ncbi:hypothetical protein [Magnetospirillum sp. UT-4]|uniref:hypothetical protein n=1 Tax=Magnetospirillum sp. UT-4 TaxID=2681467 RepID=UPI001380021C|nr:hypothetical protein [Magnetospirillum sp. UT-4]CAA7626425.1 membrane hypothetical protein [Magnetospirillum sp. UT-4]
MNPKTLFVAVLAMTALAGFTSPALLWVFQLAGFWLPDFMATPAFALYGTSLIVSVSVLLISGLPVAVFERVTGRTESDATSMLIWLGGAGLLTLPGMTG